VATALQMISWGVKVNEYGNAELDGGGDFIKVAGPGNHR
jgi:fructose-bisphosphate aldolase class II